MEDYILEIQHFKCYNNDIIICHYGLPEIVETLFNENTMGLFVFLCLIVAPSLNIIIIIVLLKIYLLIYVTSNFQLVQYI